MKQISSCKVPINKAKASYVQFEHISIHGMPKISMTNWKNYVNKTVARFQVNLQV